MSKKDLLCGACRNSTGRHYCQDEEGLCHCRKIKCTVKEVIMSLYSRRYRRWW